MDEEREVVIEGVRREGGTWKMRVSWRGVCDERETDRQTEKDKKTERKTEERSGSWMRKIE